MQNTKTRLVKLNEEYIIDLNRIVYVEKNEWTSQTMFVLEREHKERKYHRIIITLDLPDKDSLRNNYKEIEISGSKKEIDRIRTLITKE
jgi:hypothetical protein